MNVLVLGSGMYVTGRGGYSNATVLASLAEASKTLRIGRVVVAARSPENAEIVRDAAQRINGRLGTRLDVQYRSVGGDPVEAVRLLTDECCFSCAIVSVPDGLHFAYSRALLLKKIHTLVVKPLTPTMDEALELIRVQMENSVWGAVEFHKRFDEANQYAKKIYRQGQLGKILYATVDYSQKIVVPTKLFRAWVETVNPFQYLGTHYVDLFYYITGYLPVAVTAMGVEGTLKDLGINAFDSVHASVIWRNPANADDRFVANFNTNWIDPNTTSAMSDQKYKIIGTKGRIELDQKYRGIEVVNEDEGIREINPYFSEFVDEFTGNYRFAGYGYRSVHQFFKDVTEFQNGGVTLEYLAEHRPGFRNSLVSVAVVEAANYSLQHKFAWVPIDARLPA